jgi:hypothetical protein
MLEELFNLVKEQAQSAIVNNDAVPNEHNDGAIQEVTKAIHTGLSEQAAGGNLEGILQMFQGHRVAIHQATPRCKVSSATQRAAWPANMA